MKEQLEKIKEEALQQISSAESLESCPRITTLTLESGVNAKALKISSAGG